MEIVFWVALALSVFILVGSIVLSRIIRKRQLSLTDRLTIKRRAGLTPFQIFLVGFFLAAIILVYPLYLYGGNFDGDGPFGRIFKSLLASVNNTMRLFILDGDFEMIINSFKPTVLGRIYSTYAATLFVIAPILTASFVLSFFKNASALVKYSLSAKADIYLMSELNGKSVAIAEDIMTNEKIKGKKTIVFADVYAADDEDNFELITRAKRLGAICFKKSVTDVGLRFTKKGILRKIFLIGADENENVKQALIMIDRYRESRYDKPSTQFYVFANSLESEALLNSLNNGNMKVRRVRNTRNLAWRTLQDHSIFEDAKNYGGKMRIVIAGLGGYGTEMLKAICWCGQMIGYKLELFVFDADKDAEEKFKSIAPELMAYNKRQIKGEPYYKINFYSGIDVKSEDFLQKISKIKNITTVYVTLGNDELNVETAMRLRMQFGRDKNRTVPPTFAVVYSSVKSATFAKSGGLKCFDGDDYGINFIGSVHERYTLDVVEQAEMEEAGLRVHLSWAKTMEEVEQKKALYEKYEYYRRSSIAMALHAQFRKDVGLVKGVSDEQDALIEECEHKRWNAYMRAEGYVYSPVKNDIAKTHWKLKPYKGLDAKDKEKDAAVTDGSEGNTSGAQ